MAKPIKTRLQAGPLVSARETFVIPVLHYASAFREAVGVIGTVTPVAVVAIAGKEARAWRMDGEPESLQSLTEHVPELATLIDLALRS